MKKFVLLLIAVLLLIPLIAFADGSSGKLEIYLKSIDSDKTIPNVAMSIYSADTLVKDDDKLDDVDFITSIDKLIQELDIQPIVETNSDDAGYLEITNLDNGLYFIKQSGSTDRVHIVSMFVRIYDGETIKCYPKCEEMTTAYVYVTWDDKGYENLRPNSISVTLSSDHKPTILAAVILFDLANIVDTINITPEMNWEKSWNVNQNANYELSYTGVPAYYKSTIEKTDTNTWHIHNVYRQDTKPSTGDEGNLTKDLIFMIGGSVILVSAIVLLVVVNKKNGKKDNT